MINLCKFCKNEGYSKEEYKNIKKFINSISNDIIIAYFEWDIYYTIEEIKDILDSTTISNSKFYPYILNKIAEKLY